MTTNFTGLDALNLLNASEATESHSNKFSSLKSGDTRTVKIINFGDFIGVQTYSIFKKVNTFVPKNPPTLSAKGFPIDNLTPFDKAWKFYQEQSQKFGDEMAKEASQYRIKPRFAIGFYDLDSKECIVIDFSKQQAKDVISIIQKNEKKLGKKAFELEKTGSGTSTKVLLSPLDLEDLTDSQAEAFENAPTEFNKALFENLYFEMSEEKMVEALQDIKFDVTKIGYTASAPATSNDDLSYDLDSDPTLAF